MDPLTPLETLCRIILRAREYEAQTPTDLNGDEAAENVDDDGGAALSVLDDTINDSIEEELRAALDDLGEDQLAEVLAFCWVGQGTYDVADWDEANEEAQAIVSSGTDGAIDVTSAFARSGTIAASIRLPRSRHRISNSAAAALSPSIRPSQRRSRSPAGDAARGSSAISWRAGVDSVSCWSATLSASVWRGCVASTSAIRS